jgi:outer membrane protein assembly factor BamE
LQKNLPESRVRAFRFWPVVLLALTGCQWVPTVPGVSPLKIDIQQGNAISQEMLARLRVGMTRSQVRFALGTPLLVDPFRTDRWDYVFTFERGGKVIERRHITVIFDQERLARVEGDVPAEILSQINSGVGSAAPVLPPPGPGAAPVSPPVVAPASAAGAESRPVPSEAPPGTGEAAKPPPPDGVSGSNLVSGGEGAQAEGKPVAEAPAPDKPPVEKPVADKPASQPPAAPEDKGFFGRMMEKLGF